ncbi:MAG: Mut7-C RNAse domain-containing protein [Elusimicrobia bacterium]|nr:Mut7-C RNAse domain-containing protein [Elusimicrobiota bacterium]
MKFIADSMLGKLANWLRIMGYDCAFVPHDKRDTGLILLEAREPGVILLTRDTRLRPGNDVKMILFREQHWRDQLRKFFRESGLKPDEKGFFTRCTLCNKPLAGISREEALKTVPAKTAEHDYAFLKCPACGKIYWPGTHLNAVKHEIREITRGL